MIANPLSKDTNSVSGPSQQSIVLLLAVISLGFGIAHPDELSQSLNPLILSQCRGNTGREDLSWEYHPEHAVRSLLPWSLLLGWIPGFCSFPLLVQRLVFNLLAFSLVHAFPGTVRRHGVLTFAFLYFAVRPFSNTLEMYALAALNGLRNSRSAIACVAVGAVCIAGTFVRVSFPLFAWPLVLAFVLDRCQTAQKLIFTAALGLLGGAGSLAAFVAYDWSYYGKFVLPPLNNALYNSSVENLAIHGLHPWYVFDLHASNLLYA